MKYYEYAKKGVKIAGYHDRVDFPLLLTKDLFVYKRTMKAIADLIIVKNHKRKGTFYIEDSEGKELVFFLSHSKDPFPLFALKGGIVFMDDLLLVTQYSVGWATEGHRALLHKEAVFRTTEIRIEK